jgi:5-methylcytosine-specific restriction endonuclease McrA
MSDVLILNANAQPISYLPLSVIQWKEAIRYLYHDKCDVLEWYDDWLVRSPSWETKVPAVIMMKEYIKQKSEVRFSKSNLYLRDQYRCLYCDNFFSKSNLTMDHVVPLSKGGTTGWTNIVAACQTCNGNKGNKTRGWKPKYKPYKPGYWELVRKRKQMEFTIKHPSWELFI